MKTITLVNFGAAVRHGTLGFFNKFNGYFHAPLSAVPSGCSQKAPPVCDVAPLFPHEAACVKLRMHFPYKGVSTQSKYSHDASRYVVAGDELPTRLLWELALYGHPVSV